MRDRHRWWWRASALVASLGCGPETDLSSEEASPRDALAATLGALLCDGAARCCASFGYRAPSQDCRTAMRNAVMIAIIEAEDDGRALLEGAIEGCMSAFSGAIEDAGSCAELPAPAELVHRCPSAFTSSAGADGGSPASPHDHHTCGEEDARACETARGWTLVFENVCR